MIGLLMSMCKVCRAASKPMWYGVGEGGSVRHRAVGIRALQCLP